MLPDLARDKLKEGIRVNSVTSSKRSFNSYQPHPMNKRNDFKKLSLKQIVMNHQMGRSKISSQKPQNFNFTVNPIPEESEREKTFINLTKSRIEKIGRLSSVEKAKKSNK